VAAARRLITTGEGSRPEAFGPAEWVLVGTAGLIWGSSFVFIAEGLEAFSPPVVAFARIALGALTLAAVPAARGPIARQDLPSVTLLAVLWMAAPMLLFPVAQQWVDSSVAGMLNGAMPVFTVLVSAILLRRWPGKAQALGIAVGFGGVVAVTAPSALGAQANAPGILLLVLAVSLYALAANLVVQLQQRHGALAVTLRSQLIALAIVAPFAAAGIPSSHWQWSSALAMVPLGALGSGVAFVAMTTLVGRVGAVRGAMAVYFTPVVAILLGTTLRNEEVHPFALGGTVLVIAGAWLTSRREPGETAGVASRPGV
jgi:drug/metabolite transporter (DMT)-like permease